MMNSRQDNSLARIKEHEELDSELAESSVFIESEHRKTLLMHGRQVDDLLASIKEHRDLEKGLAYNAIIINDILKDRESKSAGTSPSLNTATLFCKLCKRASHQFERSW